MAAAVAAAAAAAAGGRMLDHNAAVVAAGIACLACMPVYSMPRQHTAWMQSQGLLHRLHKAQW